MGLSAVPAGIMTGKGAWKQASFSGFETGAEGGERTRSGERGFVLIGALLIMVLLALIGIAATTTTNLELQIAGAERVHKETFYQAEGGAELGALVLEENISCGGGFLLGSLLNNLVRIDGRLDFWANDPPVPLPSDETIEDGITIPAVRDFHYPDGYALGQPHINFTVGGVTKMGIGGAIQTAAGYMGRGKSAAGGGASYLYDMYIQSIGNSQSESMIHIQWRHSIGQEGLCNY
jgi:hypothetical protein